MLIDKEVIGKMDRLFESYSIFMRHKMNGVSEIGALSIDFSYVDHVAPWLRFALQEREKGVIERKGTAANPDIVKYLDSLTMAALYNPETDWTSDETNWCAAFVNWCLTEAGYAGTNMGLARSFLHWPGGYELQEPVVGCIAVFERGNSPNGHIGFYLKPTNDGDHIFLLGGNQNNRVKVSTYKKSQVLGYRWPRKFASR